jgi:hypothetical protein
MHRANGLNPDLPNAEEISGKAGENSSPPFRGSGLEALVAGSAHSTVQLDWTAEMTEDTEEWLV